MEKLKEKKAGRSYKLASLSCLLALLLLFTTATVQRPPAEGTLALKIQGLENSRGVLRVVVFDQSDGFPDNRKKAVKVVSAPAQKGSLELMLAKLPLGKYAVAVLHDENENGVLDTNLVGYPKEGYGFSNNNLPTFRAPTFAEAAFQLVQAEQTLVIRIRN